MRHRVAGKKLNRNGSHRKALAKNLMRSFVIEWQGKGHIVTTRSKAKFVQPKIEKLISLSRNKTVHNIRRAMAILGDREVVQLLFDEIGPYYSERPGGYTRVLRMVKPRLGDAAVQAYLGYVREDDEYPEGDCRRTDDDSASQDAPAPAAQEADAGDAVTAAADPAQGDDSEQDTASTDDADGDNTVEASVQDQDSAEEESTEAAVSEEAPEQDAADEATDAEDSTDKEQQ